MSYVNFFRRCPMLLLSFIAFFTAAPLYSAHKVVAKKTPPKVSLYDLKSKWLDTSGNSVQIDIEKGHLTLISMIYTSCAHVCPMTISKMQSISQKLSKEGVKDLKVVLASFDPKRDIPKKLKEYQISRKLNPKQYVFLSPPSDAVARELAVVLGISYKDLGDGDFSHSNIITLLDRDGSILASIDNLNADPAPILKAAKKSK